MARLFKHAWSLRVDDLKLDALNFKFAVEKDTKAEPNRLQLQVFNLSRDHVAQITKRAKSTGSTGVNVQLSAGYVDDVHLIFDGDAREIFTTQNDSDRITTIAAHDGGRAFRESRINQAFAPGASVSSVIQACAKAMSIGIGNANDVATGSSVDGLGPSFPNGITLSGKASDQLTRVARAAGLTWSVQNGVLQLLKGGQPLQTAAVRIASDTGMVGSPSVDMECSVAGSSKSKTKKAGLVNVRTLMVPGIYPGRKVVLDTEDFNGGYQVVASRYIGDTAGNEWEIHSKVKAY